jgi:osmotically-inducible protein OsmY
MARAELGRRLEQHFRRGESERHRHPLDRGHDDREFYGEREIPEEEADYGRPIGRRHWRGHDYDAEEEFERGRAYGGYSGERERSLTAEHRNRFLRSGAGEEPYDRASQEQWSQVSSFRDTEPWSGPYAGRGPKGYRRSDERIYEEVCERLTEHPSIDASEVEVSVSGGDVTLAGRVESRAVKHLTETMVETVSGVKEVHNQLRVVPPENESSWRMTEERNDTRMQEAAAPRARRR